MAVVMTQPIPTIRLLRPGTFTSAEGRSVTFSLADLEQIASGYDVANDPAPLVKGHPKIDDPAMGWTKSLAVQDGELVAVPDRVEPSFAEEVKAGRYAKVSAQLYTPTHPNNPRPGGWYLKHIGFLGAHAPGVRGLGTVAFAGDDDGHELLTVAFAQSPQKQEPDVTDPKKKDDADTVSFAEREAELASREQAIKDREAALDAKAAEDRHADHVSFAEGLTKGGKLAPAAVSAVVGVMDALAGDVGGEPVISFGETKVTPIDAFKKLFDSAVPLVSLGEMGGKQPGEGDTAVSFAAPAGYDVDPEAAALHARAKALQDADPKLSWMDAVRRAA